MKTNANQTTTVQIPDNIKSIMLDIFNDILRPLSVLRDKKAGIHTADILFNKKFDELLLAIKEQGLDAAIVMEEILSEDNNDTMLSAALQTLDVEIINKVLSTGVSPFKVHYGKKYPQNVLTALANTFGMVDEYTAILTLLASHYNKGNKGTDFNAFFSKNTNYIRDIINAAAEFGNTELIKVFDNIGIDFTTISSGWQPLDLVLQYNQLDTAKFITNCIIKKHGIEGLTAHIERHKLFTSCGTKEALNIFLELKIKPSTQQIFDLLAYNLLLSDASAATSAGFVTESFVENPLELDPYISHKIEFMECIFSQATDLQALKSIRDADNKTLIESAEQNASKYIGNKFIQYLETKGFGISSTKNRNDFTINPEIINDKTPKSTNNFWPFGGSNNKTVQTSSSKDDKEEPLIQQNVESNIEQTRKEVSSEDKKKLNSVVNHGAFLLLGTVGAGLIRHYKDKLPKFAPKVLSNLKITIPALIVITMLSFIYNNPKDRSGH